MKYLKMFGLAALAAALMAFFAVGTASATIIEKETGKPLPSETAVTSESEGTTTLHPPFGSIECKKSSVSGTTTNAGGENQSVSGNLSVLSWTECNAVVTPIKNAEGNYGSLSISHSSGSDGTLSSTNSEVTVEYVGFHCVYKTNNTNLGTVTGSATTGGDATLDISATISRTGGRSGAFCGSTAAWTGSYKVTAPTPLNITAK